MSKASRDKGRRLELEFAKRFGGKRINDEGLPGPDVEIDLEGRQGWTRHPWHNPDVKTRILFELKGRAAIAVLGWLDEAYAEGADYLAVRRDRDRNWYIVHPITQSCPAALHDREDRPNA